MNTKKLSVSEILQDIQKVPISQILPHPKNPRIRLSQKDSAFRQIQKSYKAYGRLLPYIVNRRNNYCLSGNQRMAVDIAEGVTEAYVVYVDLDPEKEKGLMIALNSISGHWDNEKLAGILEEFTKVPDFDFESIGFTMPEVSQILDRYGEQKDPDDFNFDASLEAIKEPVIKRGDIIELGLHRLVCGDSASSDDLKLLMNNEKAAMLFSDPPYGISYYQGDRPNMSFRPKKCRKYETIYKDDLPEEEYQKWLESVFLNIDNFLAPGAPIYVFNAHKQFFGMYGILRRLKYHVGTVIVWAKPNFSISYGDYNPQVEFCVYGWKEDNGAHKWYGPTNETTLWEIKRDSTKDYQHLTQKPIAIPARAIVNSSQRGDIVLELFGGSGSTLIAAESLGRRCFCMEIDPVYCTGIVKRYIAYVGKEKISQETLGKYCKEGKDEK